MNRMRLFIMVLTTVIFTGFFMSAPVWVQTAEAETVTIGGTMPLNTGLGTEAKKCWELYVDYINKSGGITVKGKNYNLNLIIYDDKYTAEGGKAGVERLVYQDKCKYVIGMIGSAPTYAAVPVTEPEKVLMMSGCATDKIIDPQFKYTVRMGNIPSVTVAKWDYVTKKYTNVKTYASIAPDDESGHSSAGAIKKVLDKYNMKQVDDAYFPRGTTDYSALATRIKTANPDFVIFPASAGEADFALQIKALYEAGYKGLKVSEFFNTDVIKKIATDPMIDGVVVSVLQNELPANKRNAASILMEKLYKEKYGNFVSTGLSWMKPLYAFLAGVKKANSLEVDDIMAAFAGLEFMHSEGMGLLVRRPDMNVNRIVDTVVSVDFGTVKSGKVVFDEGLNTDKMREGCERVFGGSWK